MHSAYYVRKSIDKVTIVLEAQLEGAELVIEKNLLLSRVIHLSLCNADEMLCSMVHLAYMPSTCQACGFSNASTNLYKSVVVGFSGSWSSG